KNTPVFHSSVCVEGIPCGTGDGYSKKESDQNAAQQALKRIKRDKELLNGIKSVKNTKN
ncbi:MAG: ribonuclease III, partial [Bacteroidaceae bacterium]|nr:ribonuclease III [Bacteroidaceae bacterium]